MLGRRRELDDLRRRVARLERELDDARLDPGLWVARRVADELGLTVRSGPFAGLRYVQRAAGAPHLADCLPAKLLGSYERTDHAEDEGQPVERLVDVLNRLAPARPARARSRG